MSECIARSYFIAYLFRSGGRLAGGLPRHARLLFAAARFTRSRRLRALLRTAVAPSIAAGTDVVVRRSAPPAAADGARKAEVRSVLLLKAPGDGGEKGVLFAGNEMPWPALAQAAGATRLLEIYDLVALSAWSPPKYEKLAEFVGLAADPVLVGVSNPDDLQAYQLLAPAISPMPLMASDWLEPEDFHPRPRDEREIDVLMVAGWARYKRHWLLFEALRGLPRTLNVVLIGRASGGRTLDDVKADARAFGVKQQLIYYCDVPIHEVYDYQCRSRVSVIFSGREGACVAVTESFFADTPVGVMDDAHIGSKAHINPSTGVLFSRQGLARQLASFLESSDRFSARAWAVQNISCERSSAKLNELLKARALTSGRPWTRDIAPLFRRYFVPRYLHAADEQRLAPAREELRQRYGLALILPDTAPAENKGH
jgi:glycosyltransferase involved in cell wall biosynthesis